MESETSDVRRETLEGKKEKRKMEEWKMEERRMEERKTNQKEEHGKNNSRHYRWCGLYWWRVDPVTDQSPGSRAEFCT
jgi:hypothetical protein